jgi:hypothetical protein
MRKTDNPKFNELMAILSETYKPFSPEKEKIWAAVFRKYEIEDFETAIFKHISDEVRGSYPEVRPADILRFMPKPEKPLQIEEDLKLLRNKETQDLIDKYHPVTGSYFKTIITNETNIKVEK